jgi:uncharacterized membrane protein
VPELVPLLPILLFLHLLGAVAGIGPTFAFARISGAGRADPAHGTFATRVIRAIQGGLTVPLAALTLGTGFAMLAILGYDLGRTPWLLGSILLFLSSFGYAILVQNRDLYRIIEITSRPGAPVAREAAALARARKRARWGGLYMRVAVVVILFLMVFKPAWPA